MKLFNKPKEKTSNEYYDAYKAEIGIKEAGEEIEKNGLFSLKNLFKLEILAILIGFILLNQSSLTSKLTKMYVANEDSLPVSMQYDDLDKELIVTQEDDTDLNTIAIREERIVPTKSSDKEDFADNGDLDQLIELLRSEVKEDEQSEADHRIIISQK